MLFVFLIFFLWGLWGVLSFSLLLPPLLLVAMMAVGLFRICSIIVVTCVGAVVPCVSLFRILVAFLLFVVSCCRFFSQCGVMMRWVFMFPVLVCAVLIVENFSLAGVALFVAVVHMAYGCWWVLLLAARAMVLSGWWCYCWCCRLRKCFLVLQFPCCIIFAGYCQFLPPV